VAEKIKWSTTFDVALGPRIMESGSTETGAYDKLHLELAGNDVDIDTAIQPSGNPGDVKLLVLRASKYDVGVTYSADAGATKRVLDGPVVLIGAGAVSLLADPPKTLRFTNPDANPVSIDILVGRKA
jgi:hypothetical protein